MGDEREFRIKITTSADASGTRKTKAELENLSPETQKYIQHLKYGSEAADKMDLSHRNMRYGLRLLGPEFMEVGHLAVGAFANPMTAGFLAAAVMAGKLYNDWAKAREAIEKAPDLGGIERATAALGHEGMLKALEEGTAAAEEFWDKLDRLGKAQETLKEKTDDATEAIKGQTEADNKTLSAKEKAELAELRLAKTRGEISEEQYESRKAGVEQRFEDERANNRSLAADQIIEQRRQERTRQGGIVAAGPDVVTPREIAAERAKGELDVQKGQLAEWKKALGDIDKWFKEQGPAALHTAAGRKKYAGMETGRVEALTEITEREQGTIPAAEAKAKSAATDLVEAQRRVEEAQKRQGELDREIARLEAQRSRDEAARREEGAANNRTRAAEAAERTWSEVSKSPEGKALREGADLEAIKESGGRLTVQQQSTLASVRSLLERHGLNGEATLRALALLDSNTRALNGRIEALAGQMAQFGKQIRGQASPP